jgi:hypothetical protein
MQGECMTPTKDVAERVTRKDLLKLRSIMKRKDGEPQNIDQFFQRWARMMKYLDRLIEKDSK